MEEEDTQLSEGRSLQGELNHCVGGSLACLRKRKKASAVERDGKKVKVGGELQEAVGCTPEGLDSG